MGFDPDTSIGGRVARFPSTRPSVIASATHPDERIRRDAFDAIIAAYWKPVYKYIRLKWRQDNESAKDLTQAFLADLLTDETIARFDPARASFRTYVRLCVDGFVGHAQERAGRLKRGGGLVAIPLDAEEIERELPPDPGPSMEEFFEREWRRQMFALAIDDLRDFARVSNKDTPFRVFEAHDLVDDPPSYAELAARFRLSEATVTNHLAWARRELRRLVLARVARVTGSAAEQERDGRSLFRPDR